MFNNVRHGELLAAHSFNLMNGSERSLIFHLGRRSVLCRRRRNENETGDTTQLYPTIFSSSEYRRNFSFSQLLFTFRPEKIEHFISFHFIPIGRFEFFRKIVLVEIVEAVLSLENEKRDLEFRSKKGINYRCEFFFSSNIQQAVFLACILDPS